MAFGMVLCTTSRPLSDGEWFGVVDGGCLLLDNWRDVVSGGLWRVSGEIAGGSAVIREVGERDDWNEAVERLGGGVLQSWEWGEFRRHHGWRPMRLLAEEGAAQVLLRDLPGLGSLAYVPHGPVAANNGALIAVAEAAAERAGEAGAALIEVEPRVPESVGFRAKGFTVGESSVQPRCTLVVDVLEDEEKQLAAFPKDTRYGVRRAGREGVEASVSGDPGDLEKFMDLHEETAERQEFAVRPREYYRRFLRELPAHLIVAKRDEEFLAGAIMLVFGGEASYLYGASTRQGENLYASYLTQFEALTVARTNGARRYDMWGIPCEPHEDHPLWGVYKFKKKFGGQEERYVGTQEKSLKPLQAWLARKSIKSYYKLQRLRNRGSGPVSD